jgi:hypothetical protein
MTSAKPTPFCAASTQFVLQLFLHFGSRHECASNEAQPHSRAAAKEIQRHAAAHIIAATRILRDVPLVWYLKQGCALPLERQRHVAVQTKESNLRWSGLPLSDARLCFWRVPMMPDTILKTALVCTRTTLVPERTAAALLCRLQGLRFSSLSFGSRCSALCYTFTSAQKSRPSTVAMR